MVGNESGAFAHDGLLGQILNSKAFAQIPPENLKKIVARIEMLPVKAGETIIRQGEMGDSFYILREGRCRVVSYTSVEDDTVEIATLGPGDSFGEEALIRGTPRSATVEMMSDGYVARLSKQDFEGLIQKPLLQGIDVATAQRMIRGGSHILDVRSSAEFANYSIPNSRSIPLDFLRRARRGLDANKTYIVCSDHELESALGAFLIAQKGFDARYLAATVADYLTVTGEYDKESVVLPGSGAEQVIELPEEYLTSGERSVVMVGTSVVEQATKSSLPPGTIPAPESSVALLRQEITGALAELMQRYESEMRDMRIQFQQQLDSRSKLLLQEFETRLRELERRLTAPARQ